MTLRASQSEYLRLYDYLTVLTAQQIRKLRHVAVGMLDMSAFSEEEWHVIEARKLLAAGPEVIETSH